MFRILSLDGGGIRGTYTAAVLVELQAQLKQPIADYFDLIVGTSTGGIIALGLGCDIPIERILAIYKESGAKVFSPARTGWGGWIDRMVAPKFDNSVLERCLRDVFAERRFSDISRSVAVTSFDAASAHPIVFKTRYHASLNGYGDMSVVEVALATSAAPTYFPAARTGSGVMIDGGVWANCPVMVGITEALTLFDKTSREIRMLSVGTTTNPEFIEKPARDGGIFHWVKSIPGVVMHASKIAAIEQAKKLSHEFVRVDEVVDRMQIEKLDDVSAVDDLEARGRGIARRMFQCELKKPFFSRRAKSALPC
jgi:patatin-like phospholipase/acyl hydrolase